MGARRVHTGHTRLARSSASSGRTAPERARCSSSSVGLLRPSAGSISVLGGPSRHDARAARSRRLRCPGRPDLRGAVDRATTFGSAPGRTRTGTPNSPKDRIARLGLDPRQKAGELSGGQRAQLALTLAVAKRPELLVLDEPVASLDPLARREFLQGLMEVVAEHGASVILSSHLVADLERVCDYLLVLVDSRVQVAGDIDELLATHHRLTGPRREPNALPSDQEVIVESSHRPPEHARRANRRAHPRSVLVGRAARPRRPRPCLHERRQARKSPTEGGGPAVIRLTLRQFRTEAIIGFGLLAVLADRAGRHGPCTSSR